MKSKILSILTAVMLTMVMLTAHVNAATVSADKEKYNVGDTVTVTVTTEEKAQSLQFNLEFDGSKFEYVSKSADAGELTAKALVQKSGNEIVLTANDETETTEKVTGNKISVKFTAKEAVEGATFKATVTEPQAEKTKTAEVKVTVEKEAEPSPSATVEPTATADINANTVKETPVATDDGKKEDPTPTPTDDGKKEDPTPVVKTPTPTPAQVKKTNNPPTGDAIVVAGAVLVIAVGLFIVTKKMK